MMTEDKPASHAKFRKLVGEVHYKLEVTNILQEDYYFFCSMQTQPMKVTMISKLITDGIVQCPQCKKQFDWANIAVWKNQWEIEYEKQSR